MPGGEELREPLRFADDDDSDDLGGFGRGKRPFEDDEDEENGGWAINEDHSDRLWDSADDVDDDEEETAETGDTDDVEEDEEEEADLFGGGAPRGRRGRPKGSTNANRDRALMGASSSRDSGSAFGGTGRSLFEDQDAKPAAESSSTASGDSGSTPSRTAGASSRGTTAAATRSSSRNDGARPAAKKSSAKKSGAK